MRTNTPTPAPQKPRLYRWRLTAPGNPLFCLQIVAATPAQARKIASRFYPGLATLPHCRFPI